jgi:hypothetical protein
VVVRPPSLDKRTPIVDLTKMTGTARLVGGAASLGAFSVEDPLGNRLVDVHVEAGHRVSIVVPADETLFLRSARGEATLQLRPESRVAIEGIALATPATRPRGAMDDALRDGLFASPFGPAYYRGFVDSQAELVPVPEPAPPARDALRTEPRPAAKPRTAAWIATSLGAGAAAGALVFGGLALDARSDALAAQFERPATEAQSRFETHRAVAIGLGAAAAIGIGVGAWLFTRPHR